MDNAMHICSVSSHPLVYVVYRYKLAANTTEELAHFCVSQLTVSLDEGLRRLHLFKQVRVANDSCSVAHLATGLV